MTTEADDRYESAFKACVHVCVGNGLQVTSSSRPKSEGLMYACKETESFAEGFAYQQHIPKPYKSMHSSVLQENTVIKHLASSPSSRKCKQLDSLKQVHLNIMSKGSKLKIRRHLLFARQAVTTTRIGGARA